VAWRIHEQVIRGEIDNRQKGVVRGRLWLDGVAEPIVLELTGNACADLAGCRLGFHNPGPTVPLDEPDGFNCLQCGTIGELTASRKVRVFDLPFEEAYAMLKRGEKPPEHLANCLYLEWFSEANGRVVVESTAYRLEISEPVWRLTPEDDEQRAREAAEGFSGFMGKVSEALGAAPPMNDGAAADDEDDEAFAEVPASESSEPVPDTEGVDWVRDQFGDVHHPLTARMVESSVGLIQLLAETGLEGAEAASIDRLVHEFRITCTHLAAGLDPLAYGREKVKAPNVHASLELALNHLDQCLAHLGDLVSRKLVAEEALRPFLNELGSIRQEARHRLKEFRELSE